MRVMCWNIQKLNSQIATKHRDSIRQAIASSIEGNLFWVCFLLENKNNAAMVADILAKRWPGVDAKHVCLTMGGNDSVAENLIALCSRNIKLHMSQWKAWTERFDGETEEKKREYEDTDSRRLEQLGFLKRDRKTPQGTKNPFGSETLTPKLIANAKKASALRSPIKCQIEWEANGGMRRTTFLVLHAPGPQDFATVFKTADKGKVTYANVYIASVLGAARDEKTIDFIIGDCNEYETHVLDETGPFLDLMAESKLSTSTITNSRLDRIYWRSKIGLETPVSGVFPVLLTQTLREVSDHRGIYVDIPGMALHSAPPKLQNIHKFINNEVVPQKLDFQNGNSPPRAGAIEADDQRSRSAPPKMVVNAYAAGSLIIKGGAEKKEPPPLQKERQNLKRKSFMKTDPADSEASLTTMDYELKKRKTFKLADAKEEKIDISMQSKKKVEVLRKKK